MPSISFVPFPASRYFPISDSRTSDDQRALIGPRSWPLLKSWPSRWHAQHAGIGPLKTWLAQRSLISEPDMSSISAPSTPLNATIDKPLTCEANTSTDCELDAPQSPNPGPNDREQHRFKSPSTGGGRIERKT